MVLLLTIAFLSGVVTILAPCIWPLLPLLLSVSAGEGKARPAGIVAGIVTGFVFFTLFLSYILALFPIPPDTFRTIAASLIVLLGVVLLIPYLEKRVEFLVSRFSGMFGGATAKRREGFWGGYGTGLLLGVLWSPCAGPILAAVATLAATQSVTFAAFLITLAFGIGVGIPLFVLSVASQKILGRLRGLGNYSVALRRILGILMILTALAILTNFDKQLQASILERFPGYGSTFSFLEENSAVQKQLDTLTGREDATSVRETSIKSNLKNLGSAPEFAGVDGWLNTDHPLSLVRDLRGKVVLIDFWTYSCINCIRTLPFVTGWYEKYKDQGFVVVGVHTPEFAFERDRKNVINALARYGIHYPVALDNTYGTWQAYGNRYWPAHYLIDAEGNIRYTHFGEGKYDETERAIQSLLKEAGMQDAETTLLNMPSETGQRIQTPETYLGNARRERFVSPERVVSGTSQTFTIPSHIPTNSFSLGGEWKTEDERVLSGEGAILEFSFRAKKVFLVMSPPESGSATVKVFLDGIPVSADMQGADAPSGMVMINSDRLYELVNLSESGTHTLRLEFDASGIGVYAFTFG